MSNDRLSTNERLAQLETSLEMLQQTNIDLTKELKEANEKLSEISHEFSRYKGIAGGVMLAITCVGAFFKMILPFLQGK